MTDARNQRNQAPLAPLRIPNALERMQIPQPLGAPLPQIRIANQPNMRIFELVVHQLQAQNEQQQL